MAVKKINNLNEHENPSTNENPFNIEDYMNANWEKIIDVVDNNADELSTAQTNVKQLQDEQKTAGDSIQNLQTRVSNAETNKVDKIAGKGLSTNDFTTAYKTKLDNLQNYDDTEIKQEIADIKEEQIEQNEEIENNKQALINLETEKSSFVTVKDASEGMGKVEVFGVSKQETSETSPSPEFLSKIENVGSKNLVGGALTNGVLNANGTLGYTNVNTYRYFRKQLKAGTYVYSYRSGVSLNFVRAINLTTASNLTVTNNSFALEEDAEISFTFRKADNSDWNLGETLEDIEFMLEEGTTATKYEPRGVKVTIATKNLANAETLFKEMQNFDSKHCSEEIVDGKKCIKFFNNCYMSSKGFRGLQLPYKENTRYVIRAKMRVYDTSLTSGVSTWLMALNKNSESIGFDKAEASGSNWIQFSFLTNANFSLDHIAFSYGNGADWLLDMDSLEIYEATSVEDYVQNREQTIIFPLADGQRLMQGDYLAADGIHHVRKQIKLNGAETWATNTNHTNEIYLVIQTNIADVKASTKNALCSHAKFSGTTNSNTFRFAGTLLLITVEKSDFQDVNAFKTYLQENNVTVEYELNNETIEPYTEEQQQAYNQLQKAKTYKGITNVYTDKAELVLNYVADTQTYIDNKFNALAQQILNGGN